MTNNNPLAPERIEAVNKSKLWIEDAWQFLVEHGDTIRAALEFAQKHQWQPIETAPKDGTYILGYGEVHRDGRCYVDVQICKMYWDDKFFDGTWWVEPVDIYGIEAKPTHWMPLPLTPQGTEDD